ncbi:MAG: DUF971 domain-containing protein [Proteobacteria bacterium]|nr:DUF971 domain-containing protein [Pseudomonadota bacterium]
MPEDRITQAHRTDFATEQITPVDLKLKRAEQELRITWKDGRGSVYPAAALRKACPCATCRTEREKQAGELLPILKSAPAEDLALVNAQLVGNYALQLFWSDGHDTGIFDYKYLRALDSGSTK